MSHLRPILMLVSSFVGHLCLCGIILSFAVFYKFYIPNMYLDPVDKIFVKVHDSLKICIIVLYVFVKYITSNDLAVEEDIQILDLYISTRGKQEF